MMNVRDLKLAIACGTESDEIKAVNEFFDDLFSDLKIYTYGSEPDLIFMKGDKFIMKQDLQYKELDCAYRGFWENLENLSHTKPRETQEIIQYKVEEVFKLGSLIPHIVFMAEANRIMTLFIRGNLTPYIK